MLSFFPDLTRFSAWCIPPQALPSGSQLRGCSQALLLQPRPEAPHGPRCLRGGSSGETLLRVLSPAPSAPHPLPVPTGPSNLAGAVPRPGARVPRTPLPEAPEAAPVTCLPDLPLPSPGPGPHHPAPLPGPSGPHTSCCSRSISNITARGAADPQPSLLSDAPAEEGEPADPPPFAIPVPSRHGPQRRPRGRAGLGARA